MFNQFADGAAWFDPSIAHIVLQATTNSKVGEPETTYKNYDLTAREAQILKLMTEGYSNMEIAQHLVISVNTTKAMLQVFCKTRSRRPFTSCFKSPQVSNCLKLNSDKKDIKLMSDLTKILLVDDNLNI